MAKKRVYKYRKMPANKWPALIDEARRFWPTIVERNLTTVDAAKAIGIAIGFTELAPSTVRDWARSEGREWPGSRGRLPGNNKNDRLRALAGVVALLCDHVKMERPEGLTALISGATIRDDAAAGPLFGGDESA